MSKNLCNGDMTPFSQEESRYSSHDTSYICPGRQIRKMAEELCDEGKLDYLKLPTGLDLISLIEARKSTRAGKIILDYLVLIGCNINDINENILPRQSVFNLHDLNLIRFLSLLDLSTRVDRVESNRMKFLRDQ